MDPGFPVGGGANPLGGAPTYDFVKFSEKLHEIEKILDRRGGARRVRPPKSATAYSLEKFSEKVPKDNQHICYLYMGLDFIYLKKY